MPELENFYNHGFGWVCRHCVPDNTNEKPSGGLSRLMSEGEAESKSPSFSTSGLAKWADPACRILMCPTCGITELADRS
ncbi:MAG TPA: hypothetical protein VK468_11100 [Pyrinomonadaceae bacterium]|nr:hypothetical protein [Pyrinomonadaceae bacterium]